MKTKFKIGNLNLNGFWPFRTQRNAKKKKKKKKKLLAEPKFKFLYPFQTGDKHFIP